MPDCPQCKLSMQQEMYENQPTWFCNQCWGHWMSHPALSQILKNEFYEFSSGERNSLFAQWAGQSSADTEHGIERPCPDCEEKMQQMQFVEGCPVVIDSCKEHGVWLDTAELKQIQIFLETTGMN